MSSEKRNKGFLKGIKSEFGKITWPTKNEIFKMSAIVIVSILAVSIVTRLLDMLFRFLLSFTV